MDEYHHLVESVLQNGNHKANRTGVDTVAAFSQHYEIDLEQGFPLLTSKNMSGYVWNSLIHEFIWYLSGEEHIRTLREETGIWDDWADEEGRLQTAYSRYWRRYPMPDDGGVEGEVWPYSDNHRWIDDEDIDVSRWTNDEGDRRTFDQIQYALDMLVERPNSRRIVINAWHPANSAVSKLPACHYTFAFNVQNGRLNTHLTQRSGDTALGIPFNIAAYSLLTHAIAQQVGLDVGTFSHTVVDTHLYCGKGERGAWYAENLGELQERMHYASTREDFRSVREWVLDNAPEDEGAGEVDEHEYGHDHIPGILEQLAREPYSCPAIEVADKPVDDLEFDDINLTDYDSHGYLKFDVAT